MTTAYSGAKTPALLASSINRERRTISAWDNSRNSYIESGRDSLLEESEPTIELPLYIRPSQGGGYGQNS